MSLIIGDKSLSSFAISWLIHHRPASLQEATISLHFLTRISHHFNDIISLLITTLYHLLFSASSHSLLYSHSQQWHLMTVESACIALYRRLTPWVIDVTTVWLRLNYFTTSSNFPSRFNRHSAERYIDDPPPIIIVTPLAFSWYRVSRSVDDLVASLHHTVVVDLVVIGVCWWEWSRSIIIVGWWFCVDGSNASTYNTQLTTFTIWSRCISACLSLSGEWKTRQYQWFICCYHTLFWRETTPCECDEGKQLNDRWW